MERKIKLCMCCGLSHEKVIVRPIEEYLKADGIVAVYACPINKSMAYLTEYDLRKREE